ncbi:DUF370 domain-containing protein [Candidatus Riflebacteria bacterium]
MNREEKESNSNQYKLLNIGYGSYIPLKRVVAIIGPDSAPLKRMKDYARKKGMLVDATFGRKTRSLIITDSNHVILSAIQPETNAQRFELESKARACHDDEIRQQVDVKN